MTSATTQEIVLHTPGPWAVKPGEHCEAVYSVPLYRAVTLRDGTRSHEGLVALVYGHHDAGGIYSQDANNRLIAAAPELLALARKYASECAACNGTGTRHGTIGGDGYGDRCAAIADVEYDCEDCADIRAVIAKAVAP